MGTDRVYESSYMKSSYKSEGLSAEVLKKLRSFVTDDNVSQVIITVPAKFTLNQKAATVEAAKKAGFTFCQLLQEQLPQALPTVFLQTVPKTVSGLCLTLAAVPLMPH